MVEHLPSAQGVIQGPEIESCMGLLAGSLLLPLPVSLLFVSVMNKFLKNLKYFERDKHTEITTQHKRGGGETGSPLNRKSDVGLNYRTPGSFII